MFEWLIELLQELQRKSPLEQLGYVAGAISAVAGVAFGYRRLVRRKYAKMQEDYEKLSAETDSYQLRIKDLKAEIADDKRTIDALRARLPEFQLENAEKERLEGNETKTIHILTGLYDDIRPSLSKCCFQLAQYQLSMYVDDATVGHLNAADRLVRISSLLEPERRDVRDLSGEIVAIRAELISRTGDHQTADAHWDIAFEYVGGSQGQDGMALFKTLYERAHALHREGRLSASAIFFRRAARLAAEALGPDHPETLTAHHDLAALYRQLGRYKEAEPLFQGILAKREQKLGPDHPDTLSTRHVLADLYADMGRYKEAEPLLKEILAERERKLGPGHPETLSTRLSLAWLEVEMGRHDGAEPLLKELLAELARKLGPDHPHTLITRQGLAALHAYRLGRHDEAEPVLKEVLAKQERKLGPDHPDTLSTRHSLALLYRDMGRHDEAEPLLKDALAKRARKLGPDHPKTLNTRHGLALLYMGMGRYYEAEPVLEEVLDKQERKLGPDHPDTLRTRGSLAFLYMGMTRHHEAEPLFKQVLAKREHKLGPDHPDTVDARNNLASLYERMGRHEEAERCKKVGLGPSDTLAKLEQFRTPADNGEFARDEALTSDCLDRPGSRIC